MNARRRTKAASGHLLADRHGTLTQRYRPARDDPAVRSVTLKTIGWLKDDRHATPHPEMAMAPDEIAMALAQLVRDRWTSERRGFVAGRSRLRLMVIRKDQ